MTDWFGSFLKSQENGVDVALQQTPFFDENNTQFEETKIITDIKDIEANDNVEDKTLEDLIKKLKEFRFAEAKKKSLPLYCIFANSVIEDIVTFLPTNKDDLVKIKGFGTKKSQQYGDEIINIVTNFLSENPNFVSKEIPGKIKLKCKKEKNIELPKIEKREEKEIEFIEDENILKIKEFIKSGENVLHPKVRVLKS